MKAIASKVQTKSVKPRVYYAGRSPIRVPVTPEQGEKIERITEWFRLRTLDQQTAFINRMCSEIVEGFKPDKIILFGSRAYGKPRISSDVDLLVIMPYKGSSRALAASISRHLDMLFPCDLLVRTAEEVRQRIAMEDDFMEEIVARGKVLYETNHA